MKALPTIPGYELLSPLGGGLLSAVHTAQETATETTCAVKFLRPDWEDQPTAIKLLQREARAYYQVQHPHLATMRHAHVMKPPYFIVMDLLPGESLRRRLRRDYKLTVSEALWITRQIAEAVQALHRNGFIHGDIKPDNIQLTGEGTAILVDLGFAHRKGENAAILRKGYILGTADYLAPELCGTPPDDGPKADIFSLGVTLYELLTGQLPYPRGPVDQTIRSRGLQKPRDIRRCINCLPRRLVAFVKKLLVRDPNERPNASAVVQQLIKLEIAMLQREAAA
ncbi:MAG: serine/threonine-protein kinase [Gemmataceae bacterium]